MRMEMDYWVIVVAVVLSGLTGALVSAALSGRKKGRKKDKNKEEIKRESIYDERIRAYPPEETSVLGMRQRDSADFPSGFSRPAAILIRRKTGERTEVKRPLFLIGKDRQRSDFCMEDNDAVSRIHAGILSKGDAFYLVDRNSTNGTWLNGRRIEMGQETRLEPGDRIRLADEELDFWL